MSSREARPALAPPEACCEPALDDAPARALRERILELTEAQGRALRDHAEAEYPEECCGLLLGWQGRQPGEPMRVCTVARCRNAAARPCAGFLVEATEVLRLEREGRGRGEQLLGFYHSHPDGPAAPSARDLRESEWVRFVHLVISVREGRSRDVAAFVLEEFRGESETAGATGRVRRFVELGVRVIAGDER